MSLSSANTLSVKTVITAMPNKYHSAASGRAFQPMSARNSSRNGTAPAGVAAS